MITNSISCFFFFSDQPTFKGFPPRRLFFLMLVLFSNPIGGKLPFVLLNECSYCFTSVGAARLWLLWHRDLEVKYHSEDSPPEPRMRRLLTLQQSADPTRPALWAVARVCACALVSVIDLWLAAWDDVDTAEEAKATARTSHWESVIVKSITEGAEGNEKEPRRAGTGKMNVYVSIMKVIGCLYGYMKWRRETSAQY